MATILGYETAARCWISGIFDRTCIPVERLGDTRMHGHDCVVPLSSLLAFDRICTDYRVALRFGETVESDQGPSPMFIKEDDDFRLTAARRDRLRRILGRRASHDIHVLVPDQSSRLHLENVRAHLRSTPLPPGSLVRLLENEDLFAASPELSFLQMASALNLPKLSQLGCELCSTYYYPTAESGKIGYRQLALTSTEALERFLGECGYTPNVKHAQRAVKFVVDAAHSPMETNLALTLSLPMSFGGYGLPKPLVNHPVETRNSRENRKTIRYVDLCWPDAKVAVEYNGREYHEGEAHEARDMFRQNDLVAEGWTVLVTTREHFASTKRLESLAVQIAKHIGYRLRRERLKSMHERRRLVSMLMEGNSLSSLCSLR